MQKVADSQSTKSGLNLLKKGKRDKNYFSKNLWFSFLNILVIGIVLITISYYFQQNILLKTLKDQTESTASQWAKKFTYKDVQSALEGNDWETPAQLAITAELTKISDYNPTVAQGYIYGVELQDGNKTMNIAFPQHVKEAFIEGDLNIGDMYEQPQMIVNAIKKMLNSKSQTFTKVYKDNYGTWMSILYPIMDDAGAIKAYFAIDVNASMIPEGQKTFLTESLILLAICLLVCGGLQYIVARRTLNPLKHLMKGIQLVAEGKLNFSLEEKGTFGTLNKQFNTMVKNTAEVVKGIKETAESSSGASNNLFSIAEANRAGVDRINTEISAMSDSATTQAISTSNCGTAMEEIATSLQSVATSIATVSEAAQEMQLKSEEGNKAIQSISDQMGNINDNSLLTSNTMNLLKEKSDEIGTILVMLGEVSSQTNLLALNAGIEAARAGEHGRGFSIVASEIRKLADQSKVSADRINGLIADIQAEINQAVEYVVKGSEESTRGLLIAKEAGVHFEHIMKVSQTIAGQVLDISSSTQQMSAGTEEVTSMVAQLTDVSNQNSKNANHIMQTVNQQGETMKEVSNSADQLAEVAKKLNSVVGKFETE